MDGPTDRPMGELIDGRTDEWTVVRSGGWIDGQTGTWSYGRSSVKMDGIKYGATDRQMDGHGRKDKCTDGRTVRQIDGRIEIRTHGKTDRLMN